MANGPDFQDRHLLRTHASGRRSLLVCFHHAGAGASTFTAWPKRLAALADLVLVQLKGREDRLAEPLEESLPELSARIADELSATAHDDIVLLGHSMGAIIAWWVASRLWHRHGRKTRVVVSAQSPQPPVLDRDWNPDTIGAWFDLLGEPLPEALQRSELRAIVVATLVADMAWMRREFGVPLPGPLPLDVYGLCAADDRLVTWDLMGRWQQYTTGHFALKRLPGGHLHIVSRPDSILDFVRSLLMRDYNHAPRVAA